MKINYYIGENIIDPELVDKKAEEAANSFFIRKIDRRTGEEVVDTNKSIKISQLRKFYSDVKTIERQWLNFKNNVDAKTAFAIILPLFKLLKSKAKYALKREVVPQTFCDWMNNNVDSVNEPRDFEAFLLYFEAVVGFSYGIAPKNAL